MFGGRGGWRGVRARRGGMGFKWRSWFGSSAKISPVTSMSGDFKYQERS